LVYDVQELVFDLKSGKLVEIEESGEEESQVGAPLTLLLVIHSAQLLSKEDILNTGC
jgi:hypothetical protein